MSSDKHGRLKTSPVSTIYAKEELAFFSRKCPRKGCRGHMVDVWVQYEKQGIINFEQECTECSKVIKDKRFAKARAERWNQRKNQDRKNLCG